jgi:ATP-binding cassette, subfamily B, bacterial
MAHIPARAARGRRADLAAGGVVSVLRHRRPAFAARRAGRYILRAKTGQDAAGIFWRATDTLRRRQVVVKEVTLAERLSSKQRDAFNERLLREARKPGERVRHPGAVTPVDVFQEHGRVFIVTQPKDAPTLVELVQQHRPCTPAEAAAIGWQLLDVLWVAHRQFVVHRDVHPENVLVGRDGRVRLTHFGIAVPHDGFQALSPSWFAPPNGVVEADSPAGDLWSLAATLYWAVKCNPKVDGAGERAGGPPCFDRAGALAVLETVLSGSQAWPSTAELSDRLDEIARGHPCARKATDWREIVEPAADEARPAPRRQAAARARTNKRRAGRTAVPAPRVRPTEVALYRRLLDQARPYWLHIVGVFLLSLLSSPLALLTPVPLKVVVDSVLGSHPVPGVLDGLLPAAATRSDTAILVVTAGLVVAVALLSQLQTLGSSLLSSYVGERLVLSFRARLFRHVQRLSLSYHDEQGTSDSTYRIQYDAPAIQYIAIDGLIPFVTAGITLVTMLYIVLRVDWQLGLVALAISPFLFVITRVYRRRLRRQSREAKELESSALSVAQEVLGALRVVKAFGQEDREQERFVRHSSQGVRARVRLAFLEGAFALLVGLTTALGTGTVLFIGVRHVQLQVLTLGELLLVMGYLTQLYAPLKTISKRAADLQSWLASAERAFALLDKVQDVPERPDARPLPHRAAGALAFRNVSFAYTGQFPVLRDLSFDIDPHARLGIAGLTGSGKTTLVSLLMRFYDPTAGRILLDGIDLRKCRLADLRNQFALVLQEPVLFSASIAENIAYAHPRASHEEIVAAAKAASSHEFIMRLPRGYDTQVGERGMRLSGGERQRLALARAFLKDAPILILDEPTSSVDPKTEATIMEALERLMQDRTTIMISHRESTLQPCDVRIELTRGEIITSAGI